jgi:hypothetical protein
VIISLGQMQLATLIHSADFGPSDDFRTAERRLEFAQTCAEILEQENGHRFDRATFIRVAMKGN